MKEKSFYNIVYELFINQYKSRFSNFHDFFKLEKNEIIEFNKKDIYINIIIPVCNRLEYLKKSIECLLDQNYDKKYKIAITVCEMDIEKKCKNFCIKNNINYIYLKSEFFNKSLAMNFASKIFQSKFYLFHDVDLLVQKGWIQKCIDTVLEETKKGNLDFICQPIPKRKIFYINKKNTEKFFENNILKNDLFNINDHMIQPEWYRKNYPPGGSILVSSDLFYTVQGFDPALFWSYAPEDLFFLERCISLSKNSNLITWTEGPNVYHMYHENNEKINPSYEYMVFISNLLLNDKFLLNQYGHFKLKINDLDIENSGKNNFSLNKLIKTR